MTNKEAIEILRTFREAMDTPITNYRDILLGSLDMAIESLEQRPQGEWIDYNNTFYKCPDCGYLLEKCCPQCQNKVILPIRRKRRTVCRLWHLQNRSIIPIPTRILF